MNPHEIDDLRRRHLKPLKASDDVMDMARGTTSAAAQGTGVLGFTIVLLTFLSRSLIPAPGWIWWVALAAGVLLAVKDGIGPFAVAALVVAGVMVVGPLLRSVTSPPDLEEPIPVPSGYGFEQISTGRSQSQAHVYVSKTLVNRDRAAREAAREVLQYYVEGLTELGWTDVGSDDRNAIFRAPGSDSGIWIMVNLVEPAPSVGFEPGDFTLAIQINNCPSEDSCGPRFAD